MITLADRHPWYGASTIYLKLRQQGHMVNRKRVDRLYKEAHLQLRCRTRKKVPVGARQPRVRSDAANPGCPDREVVLIVVCDRISHRQRACLPSFVPRVSLRCLCGHLHICVA